MGETQLAEGLMPTRWNTGRPCDSCRLAASTVFCGAHSAFLCLNCDTALHPHPTRHGRVLVCEVCEQAPVAFTCRADAASLCYDCDSDIHSANPLARRHERVAVEPFYDSAAEAVARSTSGSCFKFHGEFEDLGIEVNPNSTVPPPPPPGVHGVKSEDQLLFFPEPVSLLDFEFENLGVATNDNLVPVQIKLPSAGGGGGGSIIDFSRANLSTPFDYVQPQSNNHSVSSSSVDIGVVPDGSSMSDISFPYVHGMPHSGTGVLSNYPTQSSGTNSADSQSGGSNPCRMDREARVQRYREKRKNRKFEKTIRYASRKAYAEARPRIKGRFAKRIEPDSDLAPIHHHPFIDPRSSAPFVGAAVQYGVVPTF